MLKTYRTDGGKLIELKVIYSLGGWNHFTGVNERRGYYLLCLPVSIGNHGKVYTAFTGVKDLLLEVKRKSKKAEQEAIELANNREEDLLFYVCKENNLKLTQRI